MPKNFSHPCILPIVVALVLPLAWVLPTASLKADVVTVPPLRAEDAASDWRWIGMLPSSTHDPTVVVPKDCPAASGWNVQPLFDPGDGSAIPPGLLPFCLYEKADPPADPVDLEYLVDDGSLVVVAPDHMAVGPQGDDLRAAFWEELRDHFLEQAGAVTLPISFAARPRLAFLDTGPTNAINPEDGWTDNSPHGYSLVNMARELLCDSAGACVADVTARLALPHTYLSQQHTPAGGGFIGTLTELAVAIRGEVHEWQNRGAGERLILNLSLGWDGAVFGGGGNVENLPPDVGAVFHALRDAVCRGVLVIAAAGNVGGGPAEEIGPLHPAAWETRSAPDRATCEQALGSGVPDPTQWPATYWPLVYAAGGIRADGQPLANMRPGGEPRLVAFADHAVVDDARQAPTTVVTGSSAAAAIVSAAAAAVWHYRPGEVSHEVMLRIRQAAQAAGDLGRDAGFCLGNSCPYAVGRVSVCDAVHHACAAPGSPCPPLPPCPSRRPLDLSGTTMPEFPTPISLASATFSETFPQCGGIETSFYAVVPTNPCPHRQYYGLTTELWNGSQPSTLPCSSCLVDDDDTLAAQAKSSSNSGSGVLYLEIDSWFAGTLTDPTLIIGSETYSLDLASPLTAGNKVKVENVPEIGSSPASLSFTVDGTRSVTSPLLVVKQVVEPGGAEPPD